MADLSDRHRSYRDQLKGALSETPEPHRQKVYEVVEAIYRDCAELAERGIRKRQAESGITKLKMIQEDLSSLCQDLKTMVGEDYADRNFLMGEADLYREMASGGQEGGTFYRLRHIIADHMKLGPEKVQSDTSLVDDLGVDSLDMAEMVMEIEDEFGVRIPDSKAAGLTTVPDLVAYLNEHASPEE